MAHVQFVLQDEFQELGVAKPAGGGFLQARVEGLEQAGEAQLTEGGDPFIYGIYFLPISFPLLPVLLLDL